jgi:hypothetical protein
MASVFAERYAQACRRHPDLVAVHESPNGDIALVLRHTLVPLPEEHAEWRRATRAAARDVLDDLRGAGFERSVVVAQWLPVPRLARIFDSWPRRWEGDPARAGQLRRVVRQLAADRRFLAWRSTEHRRLRPPGHRTSASVSRWYTAMAPLWLRLQPELRRQLVLQTHVWIIERVQAPDTCPPPADDLSVPGRRPRPPARAPGAARRARALATVDRRRAGEARPRARLCPRAP